MLMDRKKIERWWRWAAIILAGVFLLSFVLLGVGSSSAGNVLQGCNGNSSVTDDSYEAKQLEQERFYQGVLDDADPTNDVEAMIGLARLYSTEYFSREMEAISLLDQAIVADPGNLTARFEKARIAAQQLNDPQQAMEVMSEAAAVAPDNPEVFLQLGLFAKAAGQNARAIVAWSRYLELAPDSNLADSIRGEIAVLQTLPAVTSTEPVTIPEAAPGTSPEAPAPASP